MEIQKIAAFSENGAGGNPAGVVITPSLPDAATMQRVAAEVGYSETAFAAPDGDGYRVRYFSPASEVAFCGHATIALGAALARAQGDGIYPLQLNDAAITVEGRRDGQGYAAALQSPKTQSEAADPALTDAAMALFGLQTSDLDPRLPPALAQAGARHLIIGLANRPTLAAMAYDFEAGRVLMEAHALVTIALVYAEGPQLFHARNAFASGGVVEDPATGAAAAALAGYLRDLGWPHEGKIEIIQGEDMGVKSRLTVEIPALKGSSIRVSGAAREM